MESLIHNEAMIVTLLRKVPKDWYGNMEKAFGIRFFK
jgi:hypothetical protein